MNSENEDLKNQRSYSNKINILAFAVEKNQFWNFLGDDNIQHVVTNWKKY